MRRHIVFTNGRSGSNYVVNLLNAHPRITNYGEVLGDWTLPYKLHRTLGMGGASAADYLDFIYRSRTFFYAAHVYSGISHLRKRKLPNFKLWHRTHSLGIKDFWTNFKARNIEDYLVNRDDIRVVNLYRHNALNRLVSLEMMKKTGVVASESERRKESQKKVYLPLETAVTRLRLLEQEVAEQCALVDRLHPSRVLNVSYEDLFSSQQSQDEFRGRLCCFLGVEPVKARSTHRKIISRDVSEVIENYDELVEVVRDTEFAKYFPAERSGTRSIR